jgi:tetratricopeptide (TPR) repeat protein
MQKGRHRAIGFTGCSLVALLIGASPARADDPFNIAATLGKAEQLIKKKDYAQARAVFAEVLQKDPDNYHALYRSGWVCDQLEQYGDALPFLDKASKVKPNEPDPLVERGFAEARLKQADEAIVSYRAALKKRDTIFSAWHGLGDVFFDLTPNVADAADAYLHAWHLRDRDPVVNYRLGWCYNKLTEFNLAEPHLRYVADHVPKLVAAQNELAFCYYSMKLVTGTSEFWLFSRRIGRLTTSWALLTSVGAMLSVPEPRPTSFSLWIHC